MTSLNTTYAASPDTPNSVMREDGIEYGFTGRLLSLKYEYRRTISGLSAYEP